MKTYFISDLHLSHKNILKYEQCRIHAVAEYMFKKKKFESVEEAINWIQYSLDNDSSIKEVMRWHDEMIIDNWNKVVKPTDIVWFLGDFAMGNRTNIKSFISRLNGHKRMIMGNHDNCPLSFYLENGFEYVSRYPIILKDFFILSHAPMQYITENMPFFNIFGHVHSASAIQTHTSNTQCVCVERQDFKPIRIKEFDDYNPGEEETNK